MKELIVMERGNGWYGGYRKTEEDYEQVFNTDAEMLFQSIKRYTDEGYKLTCWDKSQEAEFMKTRKTLEAYMQGV